MSTKKHRTTMPRRTEDFDFPAPQSSVKKPPAQRMSRIAQPVRKASKSNLGLNENRRSASNDRLSAHSTGIVQQTPATARKMRSHSVTPASRTPLKSNENFPIPSTVEKDKPPLENREWMMAQCERICDYLETIPDLPQEFVERRNLRTMSTKQFLVIMNHLFRQIGGSRYKLGTNFIDDIMKTMAELEYPYTVNKSMLKTPNVPHSINHIITMIGWLVQLAPPVSHEISPLKHDVDLIEEFPNCEFQNFFLDKAQDGFSVWNLQKMDEYEAVVEALTDKLVEARTNGLNQHQVQERISHLEQEFQSLRNSTMQQCREQSMDAFVENIQDQQQLKKKLHEEVKAIQKQANKIEEEYYLRQEDYYAREKKIEELKQQIETQQVDASERDEIINSISANKNLLIAKRLAVSTLEQSSYDQQIAVSRLIKQKYNVISNLNTNLHRMANNLKPLISFEVPMLDLKTENYATLYDDLQTMKVQTEQVLSKQAAIYSQLTEQQCALEHQLSDLQMRNTTIDQSLQETVFRFEQLKKQREELIGELNAISAENNQASQRKDDERLQKCREIDQLQEQCERNRKAIGMLTVEKQKLMAQNLEECHQILMEKKRMQKDVTEKIEAMEAVIVDIERVLGPLG
ncbi:kinetochore protein NDC80 homolog [Armigeres subalbatus]|uniref:kinetochore protein NDC80 homolog n=1 Tax=Armigeres subalbatus TaxID=124917 RepID=UPI002ED23193